MQRLFVGRLIGLLHQLDRAERVASRPSVGMKERTKVLSDALKALSNECGQSKALGSEGKVFERAAKAVDLSSRERAAQTLRTVEDARETLTKTLGTLMVWCLCDSEVRDVVEEARRLEERRPNIGEQARARRLARFVEES